MNQLWKGTRTALRRMARHGSGAPHYGSNAVVEWSVMQLDRILSVRSSPGQDNSLSGDRSQVGNRRRSAATLRRSPMPIRLATMENLSMSCRRAAANWAGVSSRGSNPSSVNRCRTSGIRRTWVNPFVSLTSVSGGVPTGAATPIDESTATPSKPCSRNVGKSGAAKSPLLPAAPTRRKAPVFTCELRREG